LIKPREEGRGSVTGQIRRRERHIWNYFPVKKDGRDFFVGDPRELDSVQSSKMFTYVFHFVKRSCTSRRDKSPKKICQSLRSLNLRLEIVFSVEQVYPDIGSGSARQKKKPDLGNDLSP